VLARPGALVLTGIWEDVMWSDTVWVMDILKRSHCQLLSFFLPFPSLYNNLFPNFFNRRRITLSFPQPFPASLCAATTPLSLSCPPCSTLTACHCHCPVHLAAHCPLAVIHYGEPAILHLRYNYLEQNNHLQTTTSKQPPPNNHLQLNNKGLWQDVYGLQ